MRQRAATIISAAGSVRVCCSLLRSAARVSHAACGLQQALYNRVLEKRVLELRLANEPTALLVLLGPPSCGKTGASSAQNSSWCFFSLTLLQRCSRSCCASAPSAGSAAAASSLQEFFEAFQVLAGKAKEARKPGDPWLVIIIDEANALMDWEDKKSLKALLAFFVLVTKQEGLAHVVLATSDTFPAVAGEECVTARP